MTNKELCLHQWNWLATQPNGTDKYDWADTFPKLAKKLEGHTYCAACLEDSYHNDDCSHCPITWVMPKPDAYAHCRSFNSSFNDWIEYPTQANAIKVRDCIEQTWKE